MARKIGVSSVPTINNVVDNSVRIKRYFETSISRKIKMPVYIEQATCNALALRNITNNSEVTIWLNGEEVKINDLVVECRLVSRHDNTNS